MRSRTWDEDLPKLMYSLKTTEAYSLGVAPFLLCQGYEPTNPIERNVKLDLTGGGTVQDRLADLLQTQQRAHEKSRERVEHTQKKMKERYGRKLMSLKLNKGIGFGYTGLESKTHPQN